MPEALVDRASEQLSRLLPTTLLVLLGIVSFGLSASGAFHTLFSTFSSTGTTKATC